MNYFYRTFLFGLLILGWAANAHAEIITIDGTVKSVDAKKRTITVESGTKTRSFDISSKAKVSIDGEDSGLDGLKEGQTVTLSYHDQLEVVVKVEVVDGGNNSEKEIVLFDGTNIDEWQFVTQRPKKLSDCWTVDSKTKTLVCQGNGFASDLQTNRSFENFRLTLEWRFLRDTKITPQGSGIVVRSTGQTESGSCNGIEAQIGAGTTGDFWKLETSLRTPKDSDGALDRPRREALRHAEKQVGEWNSYEIDCKEDTISLKLNGEVVNTGTDAPQRAGKVCLLSQGTLVEFRRILIIPYE